MSSDSLGDLTAQPRPLRVGDKTYQVHPLTITDFGALQIWVDSQHPDPFAAVAAQIGTGRFTPAQERHLLTAAVEFSGKSKPKLGTPEADALVRSIEGIKHLLYIAIHKGDPTFTEADAETMSRQLGPEGISQALSLTTADQVLSDPKGPETTGAATT